MSPTASSSHSYSSTSHAPYVSRWKGKGRADSGLEARAPVSEGSGGNDGVVLPMQMVGGGIYDVAYVLEVTVGRSNQRTFSLQVDTGSSDLWIAASSCSTSSCSRSGNLYNPSSSGADLTGVDFSIDYLQGHVNGPVYWDRVTIGGYSIENQALAAGTQVDNEPLSPNFNGLLGLALPLNSVIAQNLPPVTTNDPDGAAWASNLFSITPVENAPLLRYIGMTLERPGFDGRVPSVMSIGRHPSFITSSTQAITPSTIGTSTSDSSGDGRNLQTDIEYDTLLAERTGTLFWKTTVREIVVYGANGERLDVDLGRGVRGGVFPSAVLDTGVPLILATSRIANAIYGALGVTPAEDGMYYVPCSTPLNLTIKLDNRKPISIHPLDLTAEPPGDTQARFCVGLIQSADSALGSIGDMILGVPFLRNVYSVMAYQSVGPRGNFERLPPFPSGDETTTVDVVTSTTSTATTNTTVTTTATTTSPSAATSTNISSVITPRLGLLGITDPSIALEEFRQVRILRQPINTNSTNGANGNPTKANSDDSGRKLSVGIIVLIALAGFVLLAFTLFGVRWWMIRRRYKKNELSGKTSNSPSEIFNGAAGGSGSNTPRGFGFGYGAGASLSTEDTTATGRDKWMQLDTLGMGGGGYAIAAAVSKEQSRQSRIASEPEKVGVSDGSRDDTSKTRLSNDDNGENAKTLVNSKSTSTFRSESGNVGEQYIRHSRISWPPNKTEHLRQGSDSTVGSSSSSRKGAVGGGLGDRARMDSFVLPLTEGSTTTLQQHPSRRHLQRLDLRDDEDHQAPPGLASGGLTSAAPLLQNGSDDAGNRQQRDSTFDDVPSQPQSLDEYAAYASPLSSRRRRSRSRSQPRKSQVDSMGMFSPLPSSTLGDFGDQQEGVGGSRSKKNKISVDGVEFVGSVGYHAHHRKGTLSGGKGWSEESGVIGQAL